MSNFDLDLVCCLTSVNQRDKLGEAISYDLQQRLMENDKDKTLEGLQHREVLLGLLDLAHSI